MKKLAPKIWAIVAMAISIISFLLLAIALINSIVEEPPAYGISQSFALWIFAVIVAMISLFFYILDAAKCIEKLIMKKATVLDVLLILVIFGSVPMVIFVGGSMGINILIWNLYYLFLVILEAISVIKLLKKGSQEQTENQT